MNDAMIVKALLPYFGGKRTLAPRIVAELGKHGQYFEPFCGSLAVLFAKPQSQKETVNDLHGDATNLALVVQTPDGAAELFERLNLVLYSEGLLAEARERLTEVASLDDGPQVERAYWYLLASWMGRNGTAGTKRQDYQIAVRWTKGGGSPTVRLQHVIDSLPAWHQRLQNVVILRRDALDIVDRFEDVPETAIYCDPPYLSTTRTGWRGGAGSGNKYLHEFDHASEMFGSDHERLRDALARYRKARVVVSYYDCPDVRRLYDGWTFVECRVNKNLHAQGGRGHRPKLAPELLIVNGPSLTKESWSHGTT